MKAISIRQPWTWAIVHAGKRVENRCWSTEYRGPVMIHAAKGMTADEYEDFACFYEDLRSGKGLPDLPPAKELARGGLVARANVVGCVPEKDKHLLCRGDAPWFFGPFGIILDSVEPIPFIPWRGALGLFNVPDELGGPQPLTSEALTEMGKWPAVKNAVREVVR